jgi:hypothetical protein
MLIIEDAEGEIPAEYSGLDEKVVVVTHINSLQLRDIQNVFNVDLLQVYYILGFCILTFK